jgi:hypothetical protein
VGRCHRTKDRKRKRNQTGYASKGGCAGCNRQLYARVVSCISRTFLTCALCSSGIKSALCRRVFRANISKARAVASAAEAAALCRQQLQTKPESGLVSSAPWLRVFSSAVPLSPMPNAPSCDCLILLAVFLPVLPALSSPRLLLKLFHSAGITSDVHIPYISRAQLALIGIPGHLIDDRLSLVRFTLHPPPSTLHPPPSTLHPPPSTLHPPPFTLHPPPSTLHPPLSSNLAHFRFIPPF